MSSSLLVPGAGHAATPHASGAVPASVPAATATPAGLAVTVDNTRAVALPRACRTVDTGTHSGLLELLVDANGARRGRTVIVGRQQISVPRRSSVTRAVWTPARRGHVRICGAGLHGSIQVLAHTVASSRTRPGGLTSLTARVPLPTRGRAAGRWRVPARVVPKGAAGVIVQLWSARHGAAVVRDGHKSVTVHVGLDEPSATVVLAAGALSWRRTSGAGAIHAVLLGYVSAMRNVALGGARVHRLRAPLTQTGRVVTPAGHGGVPRARSTVPATGILTSVAGNPSVIDPLAGGRVTTIGSRIGRTSTTLLRLNNAGAVHLSRAAALRTVAYLSGDIIRKPTAVDLTHPGSPKLIRKPRNGVLAFSGDRHFAAGNALVFGATRFTPRGLIAVVLSVRHTSTTTLVRYRIGGLLDAFRELDLTSQVPVTSRKAARPRVRSPRDTTPVDVQHTLDFSDSRSVTLSSSPPVTASVAYDFRPALTLQITIHQGWAGIPDGFDLHYALDTNTTLTATLTAGLAWQGSHTFDLGSRALGAFEIGPVTVVPELLLSLKVQAEADANVTFTETIAQHSHVGFTVHNSSTWGDSGNTFGTPTRSGTTQVNVGASASAELDFEFVLAIEGVAGPDASASASVSASVSPSGWHVHAGGGIGIGFDLNSLDNSVVNKLLGILNIPRNPTWSIHDLSWDWSGSNGSSGGAGDGSTGGAGGGSGTPPTPTTLGQGQGTINISPCLNLRSGPTAGSTLLGCIGSGTLINIDCTAQGTAVTGPYGTSTIWDHTVDGGQTGYVADAYVFTGTDGAVAGSCGSGTPNPPPSSSGNGRINISPCLNLRSGPGGSTSLLDCIPDGVYITIDCTAQGNSVTGPYGATTLWDHTTYNSHSGYVSDAYVYTGTANAVAGTCGGGSPPPPPTGRVLASPCLNLRSGPSGSTTLIDCIPQNTTIPIYCTAQGNAVTGPYGTETLWDQTSYNNKVGYVSDAWVYTGTSGAVAGPC